MGSCDFEGAAYVVTQTPSMFSNPFLFLFLLYLCRDRIYVILFNFYGNLINRIN